MAEWQEIRALQEIIDSWGLTDDISAEEFASWVYGVKFDFVTGGPGSDGDCDNCHGAKKKIEVRRCNQHPGEGSEDGEQHHARFHQREELG